MSKDATKVREQLRICEEDFKKVQREKVMAERRETNLREALKEYQLELEMYKSAYQNEKREKERLLGADFQQEFPSTATGRAEVSPALHVQIQVLCIFSCFPLGFSLT